MSMKRQRPTPAIDISSRKEFEQYFCPRFLERTWFRTLQSREIVMRKMPLRQRLPSMKEWLSREDSSKVRYPRDTAQLVFQGYFSLLQSGRYCISWAIISREQAATASRKMGMVEGSPWMSRYARRVKVRVASGKINMNNCFIPLYGQIEMLPFQCCWGFYDWRIRKWMDLGLSGIEQGGKLIFVRIRIPVGFNCGVGLDKLAWVLVFSYFIWV